LKTLIKKIRKHKLNSYVKLSIYSIGIFVPNVCDPVVHFYKRYSVSEIDRRYFHGFERKNSVVLTIETMLRKGSTIIPRSRTVITVIAILCVAAILVMLMKSNQPPLALTTVRVDIGPVTSYIRTTGRVTGLHDVRLGVASGGTVQAIQVIVGNQVAAGQELLQLDGRDAEQQMAIEALAVSSIEASITQQTRTLRDLRADLAAGAVSRVQVQQAEENLASLHIQQQKAEAQVNQTRDRIQQLTLRSPIAGVVTDITLRPGEVATVGTPIITISDSENLQILANLEQDDVQNIRIGMPVEVSLDGTSGKTAQERVLRIEPAVRKEGSTSYTAVWISLTSPTLRLRPNQQVDVRVQIGSNTPILRLPLETLATKDNQTAVWMIDKGTLRLQPIQTGVIGDRFVEVLSGVSQGQAVVLAEGRTLKEGDLAREAGAP
jgi:RND family efflux transporter MFP subunit